MKDFIKLTQAIKHDCAGRNAYDRQIRYEPAAPCYVRRASIVSVRTGSDEASHANDCTLVGIIDGHSFRVMESVDVIMAMLGETPDAKAPEARSGHRLLGDPALPPYFVFTHTGLFLVDPHANADSLTPRFAEARRFQTFAEADAACKAYTGVLCHVARLEPWENDVRFTAPGTTYYVVRRTAPSGWVYLGVGGVLTASLVEAYRYCSAHAAQAAAAHQARQSAMSGAWHIYPVSVRTEGTTP